MVTPLSQQRLDGIATLGPRLQAAKQTMGSTLTWPNPRSWRRSLRRAIMGSAPRLLQLVFMHTNTSTFSSVMAGHTFRLGDRRSTCASQVQEAFVRSGALMKAFAVPQKC